MKIKILCALILFSAPLSFAQGQTTGGSIGILSTFPVTFYGFAEGDFIFDSTQGQTELIANAQIKKLDTYEGSHSNLMFSVRNSRIGFRVKAPEFSGIKTSAMIEMDFRGNQPAGISETQFFTNPSFRIRHFNFRIETPYVDILIGQFWGLFGWQAMYHPNSVQFQGLPGQVLSRTPQIRVSKALQLKPVTLELAAAVMRPPESGAATPDGEAGFRLSFGGWAGLHTVGAASTTLHPLSIAVTGTLRRFILPEFAANSTKSVSDLGWGVAIDAFVPILPASASNKGNALSLLGEFAYGYGIGDLFNNLNGGIKNPDRVPEYSGKIDPGIAAFTADGKLHLINWRTYRIGAEYYLPGLDGRMWVSGNYAFVTSNNVKLFSGDTRQTEDWFDVNVFGDVTNSIRLGVEYAYFHDLYNDGKSGINHRSQFSAFYMF